MIRGWCYFIDHNGSGGAHSIEMQGMGEMRGFNKDGWDKRPSTNNFWIPYQNLSTNGLGESRQICQEHMKLERKSFIGHVTRLAAL